MNVIVIHFSFAKGGCNLWRSRREFVVQYSSNFSDGGVSVISYKTTSSAKKRPLTALIDSIDTDSSYSFSIHFDVYRSKKVETTKTTTTSMLKRVR